MKNKQQIKSFLKNKPSEMQGEITAETILRQCILMSNDKILADFSFNARVKAIIILVCDADKDRYKLFYNEVYFYDMESKSLADIFSDLIAIETRGME